MVLLLPTECTEISVTQRISELNWLPRRNIFAIAMTADHFCADVERVSHNLKNYRMISVRFQGKQFNITVIQVYAPNTNVKEIEVYEDLQDFLELTPQKMSFSL